MNRTENLRAEVRAALHRYVDVVGELLAQEHPDMAMCQKWILAHHGVDAAVMDYRIRDVQPKAFQRKDKSKKGVRFPFIGLAAEEMKINRGHLWRVLTGEPGYRERGRIIAQYRRIAERIGREGRPPKRPVIYRGIGLFAKQMGVQPNMVRDVLKGITKSARISCAWERFQQEKQAARECLSLSTLDNFQPRFGREEGAARA